jgi:hypothetical protein
MTTATVRLLTPEQASALRGQQFKENSFFNPIKDGDGNDVISELEVSQNENPAFAWVADLALIPYKAPIISNLFNFD